MSGLSRKGLLVAAGASVVAGCGGGDEEERAREARNEAELAIVRFLLLVERTTSAFWEQVVQRNAVAEIGGGSLAADFARNERTHLETLERYERRLGSGPGERPSPNFGEIFAAGPREILRTGSGFANLAAAAYLGQCNRIQDRNLLASVLAIHSVEGRQAAAVSRRAGEGAGVLPDGAFAEPLSIEQVRSRLERYGV